MVYTYFDAYKRVTGVPFEAGHKAITPDVIQGISKVNLEPHDEFVSCVQLVKVLCRRK
jgi:hypothetical protein